MVKKVTKPRKPRAVKPGPKRGRGRPRLIPEGEEGQLFIRCSTKLIDRIDVKAAKDGKSRQDWVRQKLDELV